jgi:hypothetical protein
LNGKNRQVIQKIIDASGGIQFLMSTENCSFDYGHFIVNIHETIGDGLK